MVVQHNVGVPVPADVNVAPVGAQERQVVDSAGLHTMELWLLEQDFWAAEMLVADGDDVAIWKLVGLLLVGTFCCGLQLGRGGRNVAQLLLSGRGSRSAATAAIAADLHGHARTTQKSATRLSKTP